MYLFLSIEGVQNMPPQYISLWCVDHFELKGNQDQGDSGKPFTSPLTA